MCIRVTVSLLSSGLTQEVIDVAVYQMCSCGVWIVIFMFKVHSMCYNIHATVEEVNVKLLWSAVGKACSCKNRACKLEVFRKFLLKNLQP